MSNKRKLTAKNRLLDTDIVEIAFAGTPAVPKAVFQVFKSEFPEGREPIIKTVTLHKDEAKKQVFGYALVPDEPDHQGDIISAEEIEKACHSLARNLAKGTAKGQGTTLNHIHLKDADGNSYGYIIESAIDKDGSLAKAYGVEGVPGAWWIGAQVETEEAWESVQKREITGFSIGGSGCRVPVEETQKSALGKAWDYLKALTFDDLDVGLKARDELYQNTDNLNISLSTIIDDTDLGKEEKRAAIAASIDQFKEKLVSYFAIEKAGRELSAANAKLLEDFLEAADTLRPLIERAKAKTEKSIPDNPGGGNDMDATKFDLLVKSVESLSADLTDIKDRLAKAEGGNGPADDGDKDKPQVVTEDQLKKLADQVTEVAKSFDDLKQRLEKIEKTPGTRQGSDDPLPEGDGSKVEKSLGERVGNACVHIFHGRQ